MQSASILRPDSHTGEPSPHLLARDSRPPQPGITTYRPRGEAGYSTIWGDIAPADPDEPAIVTQVRQQPLCEVCAQSPRFCRCQATFRVTCSWCHVHISGPADAPPERTSHGCCQACLPVVLNQASEARYYPSH